MRPTAERIPVAATVGVDAMSQQLGLEDLRWMGQAQTDTLQLRHDVSLESLRAAPRVLPEGELMADSLLC